MPIEDRNLAVGTRLVANYKKQTHFCTVEADGDGVAYALEDGKRFKSPSSAASQVMGGKAVNGWRFWSVEGAAKAAPAATRANSRKPATKPAPRPKSRAKPAKKQIRPHENQEDVPEGQVRYWCDACLDVFLGFAGEAPQQCPNGHRIDDPDLSVETPALE